jgi:hypothetical protein
MESDLNGTCTTDIMKSLSGTVDKVRADVTYLKSDSVQQKKLPDQFGVSSIELRTPFSGLAVLQSRSPDQQSSC